MAETVSSKDLLKLTQTMLSVAEAGDWEEVAKLEVQRQAVLRKYDAAIKSTGVQTGMDATAKDLREVLLLNKRMLALGEQVRSDLAKSMSGLRQGRNAVNAYYAIK